MVVACNSDASIASIALEFWTHLLWVHRRRYLPSIYGSRGPAASCIPKNRVYIESLLLLAGNLGLTILNSSLSSWLRPDIVRGLLKWSSGRISCSSVCGAPAHARRSVKPSSVLFSSVTPRCIGLKSEASVAASFVSLLGSPVLFTAPSCRPPCVGLHRHGPDFHRPRGYRLRCCCHHRYCRNRCRHNCRRAWRRPPPRCGDGGAACAAPPETQPASCGFTANAYVPSRTVLVE